jgi:hypothetical protein
MLAPEPYLPPTDETLQQELQAWLERHRARDGDLPTEVEEFIDAVAKKLPPYERFGEEMVMITGRELQLCGQTEINGKPIKRWVVYPLMVPRLQAVDHYSAMRRAYHRRGKSGLRRYCECHVKGPDLQKLLRILDTHVFKQERHEFQHLMQQIRRS